MAILKLFHVLLIFIWIGSLLTITRFLAYLSKESPEIQIKLRRICKRMYFFVDLPAMVGAIFSGLLLVFLKGVNLKAGWLHMKWTFAFLLIVCDLVLATQISKFQNQSLSGKGPFFKIFHAMAALFLIGALVSIYIFKERSI